MTSQHLVSYFQKMHDERWACVPGAAVKGRVDSAGAFVYALQQFGIPIPHSCNAIWRQSTEDGGQVGHMELIPGMAVFKRRSDGGEPDRFKGDGIGNYYKMGCYIGPAEGVSTEAVIYAKGASFGIVLENVHDGWTHAAKLKDLRYITEDETEPDTAIVVSRTGSTVNIRQDPNGEIILTAVPVGASVYIMKHVEGWSLVQYAGDGKVYTGWMRSWFLNCGATDESSNGIDKERALALYREIGKLQLEIGELLGIHG